MAKKAVSAVKAPWRYHARCLLFCLFTLAHLPVALVFMWGIFHHTHPLAVLMNLAGCLALNGSMMLHTEQQRQWSERIRRHSQAGEDDE